jgi:ketosteroid isomerase-like protein
VSHSAGGGAGARDRLQIARDSYGAYVSGDRSVIERLLSDDFTFHSPPDRGIDRVALTARGRYAATRA